MFNPSFRIRHSSPKRGAVSRVIRPAGEKAERKPPGCSSASHPRGHAASRHLRRQHAALRRAAELVGLGHRTEIGDEARRHRRRRSPRRRRSVPHRGARGSHRRRRPRSRRKYPRVKTLYMMLVPVPRNKFAPDFIACNIGGGMSWPLANGSPTRENGGEQHGTRMAFAAGIVIIERMRRRCVDQRGIVSGRPKLSP